MNDLLKSFWRIFFIMDWKIKLLLFEIEFGTIQKTNFAHYLWEFLSYLLELKIIVYNLFYFRSQIISQHLSEKLLFRKCNCSIEGNWHFTNILRLSSFKLQFPKFNECVRKINLQRVFHCAFLMNLNEVFDSLNFSKLIFILHMLRSLKLVKLYWQMFLNPMLLFS